MSERHVIVVIGERDDPFAVYLGDRVQVLENVHRPLAQRRFEIMEDQMGELLGHGADVGHVVPHDDVRQIEVRGRAVRHVANDQRVGDAAVLVHHDEIRHLVGLARLHQLFDLVVAAVHALRVREYQPQLFDELPQPGRRVVRRGDHDLRVFDAGPTVLVVLVRRAGPAFRAATGRRGRGRLVVPLEFLLQAQRLRPQIVVDRRVLVQTVFQPFLLVSDRLFTGLQTLPVQVLPAESRLPA